MWNKRENTENRQILDFDVNFHENLIFLNFGSKLGKSTKRLNKI